jgi:hypothetical protein
LRSIALIKAKGKGGHVVRRARILERELLSSVNLRLSLNLAIIIKNLLIKS